MLCVAVGVVFVPGSIVRGERGTFKLGENFQHPRQELRHPPFLPTWALFVYENFRVFSECIWVQHVCLVFHRKEVPGVDHSGASRPK